MELLRSLVLSGLLAGAFLVACPDAKSQVPDEPSQAQSDRQAAPSESSQSAQGHTTLLTGLSSRLTKGFHAQVGIGESYYSETANGSVSNAVYSYTNATAAIAYNLQRKQSQYVLDYHATAEYYPRSKSQDLVAQDLGLSQSIQLGRRLTINNTYRFTLTPDYAPGLLGEAAAAQASFAGPLNPVTSMVPPTLVNPIPTFTAPGDGLLTFRSVLLGHTAQSNLSYQLGGRTSVYFGAGFQKIELRRSDLFRSNLYTGSAGITHNFSARTNVGIAYQVGSFDFSTFGNRTFSQGIVFSVSHQVLRNLVLSIGGGPSLVRSQGLQTIALPPDLAALLGRATLNRNISQSTLGWIGTASVATQLLGTNITLTYDHGVTNLNGLASIADQQSYSISHGIQLGRRTQISLSGSYLRWQILGIETPFRLNQVALSMNASRQISSSVDVAAVADYSRVLTPGLPLNGSMYGISLQYHFPRSAR